MYNETKNLYTNVPKVSIVCKRYMTPKELLQNKMKRNSTCRVESETVLRCF